MLVYTLGAGITAAAGTRLALQLLLITVFGLHPFQVPLVKKTSGIAAVRRCLADCVCIGQFARLLPTLVVVAVSQAPSPESNPDSPLPVKAIVVHYTTIQADRSEVPATKLIVAQRPPTITASAGVSCSRWTSLSQPRTRYPLRRVLGLATSRWQSDCQSVSRIAERACVSQPTPVDVY